MRKKKWSTKDGSPECASCVAKPEGFLLLVPLAEADHLHSGMVTTSNLTAWQVAR